MQLPSALNYRLAGDSPRPIMTVLQRQRGKRCKSDLPHQALGYIGLHWHGDHVLGKGQTRFPASFNKCSPLGSRRHALFPGQMIRGGESRIEHLPPFLP